MAIRPPRDIGCDALLFHYPLAQINILSKRKEHRYSKELAKSLLLLSSVWLGCDDVGRDQEEPEREAVPVWSY